MGKYIKTFQNHSDYETYITGETVYLPNVSYCIDVNDVHFNNVTPPPSEPILIATYYADGGGKKGGSDVSVQLYLFGNEGGELPVEVSGASMFSKIEIDDVEVSIAEIDANAGCYNFEADTTHTVKYTLISPYLIGIQWGTEMQPTIVGATFAMCSNLISVIIPDNVIEIGNSAFYGCESLTSATLGNSVKYIYAGSFGNCISLTNINIPDSVTYIGSDAFYGCDSLYVVDNNVLYVDTAAVGVTDNSLSAYTLKDGTRFIGNYLFSGCGNLTGITIPNSVTYIGGGAFQECSGLTGITIPDSVTYIGGFAFYGCDSLYVVDNNVVYVDTAAVGVTDNSLSTYTLKDGTRFICGGIFDESENLTGITIPNSVISIGDYAFNYCTGLTSVTIPNSVTYIGDYVFQPCSGLTNVTIPNSVTYIGEGAFQECINLTNINMPISLTGIGGSAFANCSSLTSVTIPNSVTSIGPFAFTNCISMTHITIGSGLTTIVCGAFMNCSGLTSITIPNSVTTLDMGAFINCSSLTSIDIPRSVTYINTYAFVGCMSLTSIDIPSGITTIGDAAFTSCSELTGVTVNATTPPTLGVNVFVNTNPSLLIYVPSASVDAYKAASGWSDYASIIVPIGYVQSGTQKSIKA